MVKCHRKLGNKARVFFANQDVSRIPSTNQMCGLCGTSMSYVGDVNLILVGTEILQITSGGVHWM